MVFPGVGSHQCTGEVMVRAYSHVFACASTLVRRGEYRAQTGIWRLLGFVSVRTIKGRRRQGLRVPRTSDHTFTYQHDTSCISSRNRITKALGFLESKWDPICKKLVRRLLEEQDKVLRSYLSQKGWTRSKGGARTIAREHVCDSALCDTLFVFISFLG
jgi:hypothetical protein